MKAQSRKLNRNMRLPSKPSQLILAALEDLELIEQSPRHNIEMGVWHHPIKLTEGVEPVCSVCFAGSVMAVRGKANPISRILPASFSNANHRKLLALNDFRIGDLIDGFAQMGLKKPESLPDHVDWDYMLGSSMVDELAILSEGDAEARAEWKLHMQDLAGILAAEGF